MVDVIDFGRSSQQMMSSAVLKWILSYKPITSAGNKRILIIASLTAGIGISTVCLFLFHRRNVRKRRDKR